VLTLVGDGLRRWFRGKERPAVEVGGDGANGDGGGAIGRCWRLEDGVGNGEKTPVLFIGSLRRFVGKISPAVGLAGGGGARVPAGFPAAGEVTSRPDDGTARAGG
jgi:hypothetical protein